MNMEWISIKDRLPETDKEVICADFSGSFGGLKFNGMIFQWPEGTKCYAPITHWMPLPNPPQS